MDWFRVDSGLPQHHKLGRLARTLGSPRVHVGWSLVVLWSWAARNREDGNLDGLDADEIAEISDWEGDADAWLDALVKCKLVDENPDGQRTIHGWVERQPLLKRREWRSQTERDRSTSRSSDVHVTTTRRARGGHPQTDRQTYIQTDRQKTKNVCAVTSPSDITPPPDSVIVFDCQGSPDRWHLTQTQIKTWQNIYPNLDVTAECHRARAWTDAGRRKTAAGMKRFLVGWLNRSTDKGGAKPNGFNPNDPTPLTPQREREIRIAKLREDLDGFRAMGVPTAIKQAEEALRKLGVNP